MNEILLYLNTKQKNFPIETGYFFFKMPAVMCEKIYPFLSKIDTFPLSPFFLSFTDVRVSIKKKKKIMRLYTKYFK